MAFSTFNLFGTAQNYKPVDEGSKVHFTIKNFGISTGGDLSGLKGNIHFDPVNPVTSDFTVSVDVKTIDTDNENRDRTEEVGRNINRNKSFVNDNKTLLHNYITTEELRACTTCNACVEECPVSINPMDIILELRRSLIMEESNAPQEWNTMFSNVENNFAPWKFSPDERDKWTV